jgi:hypothetical protein
MRTVKVVTVRNSVRFALCIDNKQVLLTANIMLSKLRAAVTLIGVDVLGFTVDDISLHSLRSGAAMAMYLSSIPVYTIMLIDR